MNNAGSALFSPVLGTESFAGDTSAALLLFEFELLDELLLELEFDVFVVFVFVVFEVLLVPEFVVVLLVVPEFVLVFVFVASSSNTALTSTSALQIVKLSLVTVTPPETTCHSLNL